MNIIINDNNLIIYIVRKKHVKILKKQFIYAILIMEMIVIIFYLKSGFGRPDFIFINKNSKK